MNECMNEKLMTGGIPAHPYACMSCARINLSCFNLIWFTVVPSPVQFVHPPRREITYV
jgi:hypothetical protein